MFFDNVYLINANNFMEVKNLPHLEKARYDFGAVCIKNEVYVFGAMDFKRVIRSVEKYSPDTNTWEYVIDMTDDRGLYSACSFMDNVYIMGGYFYTSTEGTRHQLVWSLIQIVSSGKKYQG